MTARYFCEWGCHEHVADLTAERDRARDVAVALEQEGAALRKRWEALGDLVKLAASTPPEPS